MQLDESGLDYVTATIGGQLFGLPIARVQDVFVPTRLTRVPLASPDIAGVLNLRGRIVTVIEIRSRLGLPPRADDEPRMAVGIESNGEIYGLLVDTVGEVMRIPETERAANPVHLDPRLADLSAGVHRLEGGLLIVLNIDRVLMPGSARRAA